MSTKKPFLPTRESELVFWLLNFVAKLQEHRTLFGFTVGEVDLVAGSVDIYQWIVDVTNRIVSDSKQFTMFKHFVRNGPEDLPMGELPAFDLPPAPASIMPTSGMMIVVSRYVARIKNHDNYTESLGQDFGIIGSEDPFDPGAYKSIIKVEVFDIHREVHFLKGRADDVAVYAREAGTTPWISLGTATTSPFLDERFTPQPITVEYMVKGRIKNEEIGLPSNIVQVTYSTAILE